MTRMDHNQTYLEICVTLEYTTVSYSESSLFRTEGIFKSMSNMQDDDVYSQ